MTMLRAPEHLSSMRPIPRLSQGEGSSRKRALSIALGLIAVGVSSFSSSEAMAADGVLEINHACATSAGCFPGDAPGYPVTITASAGARSFRLTSDLVRSDGSANGLTIDVDDVSIDLGGFRITRASCLNTPGSVCLGVGASAIDAATADGLSIRNGTVAGAGNDGIRAGDELHLSRVDARWNGGAGVRAGARARLDAVRAFDNLGSGFDLGLASTVRGSFCNGNNGSGIDAGPNSRVESTIVSRNGVAGILMNVGTVRGSVADRNGASLSGNTVEFSGIRFPIAGTAEANVSIGNPRSGIESLGRGNFVKNVAVHSGLDGLACSSGCLIDRNAVRGSGDDGVSVGARGRVANNVVRESSGDGVAGGSSVLVRGNTLTGSGGVNLAGGTDLGANTCDGAACP